MTKMGYETRSVPKMGFEGSVHNPMTDCTECKMGCNGNQSCSRGYFIKEAKTYGCDRGIALDEEFDSIQDAPGEDNVQESMFGD